jgi:ABC-type transporter Mla subunit MlaD
MTPGGSDPDDDMPLSELRRVVGTLLTQTSRLKGEVAALHGEVASLQDNAGQLTAVVGLRDAEIVALKDEIARLKGLPPPHCLIRTAPEG